MKDQKLRLITFLKKKMKNKKMRISTITMMQTKMKEINRKKKVMRRNNRKRLNKNKTIKFRMKIMNKTRIKTSLIVTRLNKMIRARIKKRFKDMFY